VAPTGRLEESPDTAGQDAGASQAAKADGKWHREETATGVTCISGNAGGKSPPATAATRRLAKPRPVQGEQGPPRGCPPRARVAAKRDGHPRQNPAYRPAKETPGKCGGFYFWGQSRSALGAGEIARGGGKDFFARYGVRNSSTSTVRISWASSAAR